MIIANPIMALSRSKCLVLSQNNEAYFLDENGLKKHIVFKLDPQRHIVSLQMHEMYVIVIYETSVAIFNSTTGDFLEERGKLDKFKYKTAVVNYNGNEIYLVTHSN